VTAKRELRDGDLLLELVAVEDEEQHSDTTAMMSTIWSRRLAISLSTGGLVRAISHMANSHHGKFSPGKKLRSISRAPSSARVQVFQTLLN